MASQVFHSKNEELEGERCKAGRYIYYQPAQLAICNFYYQWQHHSRRERAKLIEVGEQALNVCELFGMANLVRPIRSLAAQRFQAT